MVGERETERAQNTVGERKSKNRDGAGEGIRRRQHKAIVYSLHWHMMLSKAEMRSKQNSWDLNNKHIMMLSVKLQPMQADVREETGHEQNIC